MRLAVTALGIYLWTVCRIDPSSWYVAGTSILLLSEGVYLIVVGYKQASFIMACTPWKNLDESGLFLWTGLLLVLLGIVVPLPDYFVILIRPFAFGTKALFGVYTLIAICWFYYEQRKNTTQNL